MTRSELREFLNSEGFPLGESTFEKICMPSRGEGRRLSSSGAIARSISPNAALSGREVGSLKLNGAPRKNPGRVLGGARRGSEGLHPGGQSEDEMHAYDTSSDLNSQLDRHRPRRLARMVASPSQPLRQ